ncbi:TraB/GumN family protein [Candidatus Woesearchaeota archaeon]|nr:TraB/GumN family protein [Candidatus Woesearchaeota archaeon]
MKRPRHFWPTMLPFALVASYYIGCGSMSIMHYNKEHKQWLSENSRNELVVQDFNSEVDGEQKHITLVGEIHVYTKPESEYANQIVKDYDVVLCEGASGENTSLRNKLFLSSIKPFVRMARYCYTHGTGRLITNDSLDDAAENAGKPIFFIEEGTDGGIGTLDFESKAFVWSEYFMRTLFCPSEYIDGVSTAMRNDEDMSLDIVDDLYEMARSGRKDPLNVAERDVNMAREAYDHIMARDDDRIMIVVGVAHFRGIREELSDLIDLVPINEPYIPDSNSY